MRAIPLRNTLESILTMNTSDPHVLTAETIMDGCAYQVILRPPASKLVKGENYQNMMQDKPVYRGLRSRNGRQTCQKKG